MVLDFGKINAGIAAGRQIDPRRIFTTLKRDLGKFRRPSDEQGDVLDGWFAVRNQSDTTLKMNTGSGKTVVGLLVLQSSLNEGVGPAVYICPDTYLVRQVVDEAVALGVRVTEDEGDAAFVSGSAILVINIWKLVNGGSVFGVGREGTKISIGALVVDDAHASLSTVGDQFTLKVPTDHAAFPKLFEIVEPSLTQQSALGVLDLKAGDPQVVMTVPSWTWQDHQEDILRLLHAHRESDPIKWSWRLVSDVLPLCRCAIGRDGAEISPRFVPIDNIPAFSGAKRRIYMTATLADDGILVSHFQADPELISRPIRPKGGGDIGDRMILAPQEINTEITTDDVRDLAAEMAASMNVVVIVPSGRRAEYWSGVADQTLTAKGISAGVARMRAGHVGLSVLVNKYDGIDLPGDACRLLIIDGLPEVMGLLDRAEQTFLDGTEAQLIRQTQRIEQGMGRGVRSSEDFCVVLLLGSRLTQRVHRPAARRMFSPATRAQLDLGRRVTEQVSGKPLSEIRKVMELCLSRDDEWVTASRNAVLNVEADGESHVDPMVVHLRGAFDFARAGQPDLAEAEVQQAINSVQEARMKGYLKQQLAEFRHGKDPSSAQELQLSAVRLNRRLVRPLSGVGYAKLAAPSRGQPIEAASFMKRFLEKNELLLWVNALIESLAWGEEQSRRFETAMHDLGRLLGFGSQRPEADDGRGPDNLWALGGGSYLVIECKSGATGANSINKHDCNQLNGSMAWFGHEYDASCTARPVIVHRRTDPEHAATLPAGTRVIDEASLDKLKAAVRMFARALGDGFTDPATVGRQLAQLALSGDALLDRFSVRSRS